MLQPYRVCIAHSCQVVIQNLEGTLRGIQPPKGKKKRRGGMTMPASFLYREHIQWSIKIKLKVDSFFSFVKSSRQFMNGIAEESRPTPKTKTLLVQEWQSPKV